jgi:hypothetical protein
MLHTSEWLISVGAAIVILVACLWFIYMASEHEDFIPIVVGLLVLIAITAFITCCVHDTLYNRHPSPSLTPTPQPLPENPQ